MTKIDIKHDFRLCPVPQEDWHLLDYFWRNRWYYDVRLPFGSRSSPFIFNAFADALLWILIGKFGITGGTHYLDDFIFAGSTRSICQSKMTTVIKLEGPAQVLTYLGIESDTVSSIIRLPEDKLKQTKTLTAQWLNRKKMHQISSTFTNRDALSFACKVVKPGRMFLRRLIDLSTTVSSLHHHIDISSSLCEDLKM